MIWRNIDSDMRVGGKTKVDMYGLAACILEHFDAILTVAYFFI
jgi:hypothetical protein